MVWREEMPDIVGRYKSRLFAIHIHDNSGSCDFHQIPGLGNINWNSIMKVVAESEYELPLTMELVCQHSELDIFLDEAYEAGAWLTKLYQQKRLEN
jgi:sugar phosphate isomerase/epimerase